MPPHATRRSGAQTRTAVAVDGEDAEGGGDDSEDWEDCTDIDSDEEDEGYWKIGLVEAPKIPEALNAEFFPSKVSLPLVLQTHTHTHTHTHTQCI